MTISIAAYCIEFEPTRKGYKHTPRICSWHFLCIRNHRNHRTTKAQNYRIDNKIQKWNNNNNCQYLILIQPQYSCQK